MDQPLNFRSAFNGFNREDVIKYLEYLNSKHAGTYNQLTGEMQLLRQKLENVSSEEVAELQEQCSALEDKLAAAQAELEVKAQLEEKCRDLEQENERLQEQLLKVTADLEKTEQERAEAAQKAQELEAKASQELEAYRRAERAERIARERADQIYRMTDGTLSAATAQVDAAAKQMDSVAESMLEQMNVLMAAVSGSRQAMNEAAQSLYKLRPEAEEE